MTVPCSSCPWRVGSDPRLIPRFGLEKARNLRNTVGDGDAFRNIMACHWSPDGDETPCVGYVAVEGWTNLSVRLMVLDGRLDHRSATEACERVDLYQSFDDMLANIEAHYPEGDTA